MGLSVVTGSNRGIGLSLATLLKERGHEVVAACRNSSPELDELGVEVVSGVDVSTQEGTTVLKAALGEREVDLVINNAGVLAFGDNLPEPKFDEMLRQFQVNAMGPLRVTTALLPNLKEGSKLAFITSRMGSIADNSSGGTYGYRMSKAALNMAAMSLSRDLLERKVAVAILHPGMVATEMIGKHNGQIEPDQAAAGLIERIEQLTLQETGTFWHQNGQVLPW